MLSDHMEQWRVHYLHISNIESAVLSKHTYAHNAELIIGLGKTLLEESWWYATVKMMKIQSIKYGNEILFGVIKGSENSNTKEHI